MMYLIRDEKNSFRLGESAEGDVFAKMLPACVVIKGQEIKAELKSETQNVIVSEAEGLSFKDKYVFKSENRIEVKRTISNNTDKRIRFKSIFEISTGFKPNHYVFPGFSYNGNEFGNKSDSCSAQAGEHAQSFGGTKKSNTPTGLECDDGQPWVFAYDRQGIPSCTLSEDKTHALALFVSDTDDESLLSADSLIKDKDGTMRHRVFHPVSELPWTYGRKNMMTEPYEDYMFLVPGGRVTLTLEIFFCVPKCENYATAELMEEADSVFEMKKEPCLTNDRIWDLGIEYFKFLVKDCHGTPMLSGHLSDKLFVMMHAGSLYGKEMAVAMEDPSNTYLSCYSTRYEIGWADQGAMTARLIAMDAFKKNDKKQLELATAILDGYVSTQWENGLLYPFFSHNFVEDPAKRTLPDSCNMGWAMTELIRSYHLLKDHGIDKPEYLDFSVKLAEFAVSHYSEEWGFGKTWNRDGSPRATAGGAGGFMIMGLTEVYKTVRDERYLETAKKAMDFYYKRDLDNFVCTAGALDCLCVDKETAYPFVRAGLDIYEETGDKLWLERAQKAAYYFFSWMFWYDAKYPVDAEFTKYGYYTTGGTLISAEHSALDPWGALLVADMIKLYHHTGNEHFIRWAKMTWCNALLGITTEEGMSIHGSVRPLGSQNEGFFHCRWTKYRPTPDERGHFNDNLQTWMGAWRLYTIASLSEEDLSYLE